jgi:hypothetical protein
VNAINWSENGSLFTFPKHSNDRASLLAESVMYITDSVPRLAYKIETEEGGLSDGIVLLSTVSPVIRGAQELCGKSTHWISWRRSVKDCS